MDSVVDIHFCIAVSANNSLYLSGLVHFRLLPQDLSIWKGGGCMRARAFRIGLTETHSPPLNQTLLPQRGGDVGEGTAAVGAARKTSSLPNRMRKQNRKSTFSMCSDIYLGHFISRSYQGVPYSFSLS